MNNPKTFVKNNQINLFLKTIMHAGYFLRIT